MHGHRVILCALKHFRNTEIPQFYRVALRQENVLRFDVSMQNLATVDVIKGKAELHEPIHDFGF